MTSLVFVGGILAIVTYLSMTKRDVIERKPKAEIKEEIAEDVNRGGLWQTGVVIATLVIAGTIGYHVRRAALRAPIENAVQPIGTTGTSTPEQTSSSSPLGDLYSRNA